MELIKSYDLYSVHFCKYTNEYWVLNNQRDTLEGRETALPTALAVAESLNHALKLFITEESDV